MVVYYLKNKVTGQMYIGATHHNYLHRVRAHLGQYHMRASPLSKAITKYGADNFSHGVLVVCASEQDMHQKEKEEIEKVPRDLLYNRIKAGIPRLSKTRAEKIRVARLGTTQTEETKNKISKTKTGVSVWPNGKRIGWYCEKAVLASRAANSKPIKCINNGKIYSSSADAAKDLGMTRSEICAVINGRRPHCRGYQFISTRKD